MSEPRLRKFDSGATRDVDDHKFDYEGSLSPLVVREFGRYMYQHSFLPDGSRRSADNWQHGFTLPVIMKSMWRHFHDVWMLHRGYRAVDFDGNDVALKDALCGVIFNAQAYLHELCKREQ